MHRLLKSVTLEDARDPLSLLIREDWLWRGEQLVDGVYSSGDGTSASHWRLEIAEYLPDAEAVLESDDAAIILFREPKSLNCDLLGNAIPLRRLHGTLTSFPFKMPQSRRAQTAIDSALLILRHGSIQLTDMHAFKEADLSDWYDASDLKVEIGVAPPRRPGVPDTNALKMSGENLFEQAYSDAGLQSIRDAVNRATNPTSWSDVIGPALKPVMVVLLLALAAALVISQPALPAELAISALGVFAVLAGLVLVRLFFGKAAPQQTSRQQSNRNPVRGAGTPRRTEGSWRSIVIVCLVAVLVVLGVSRGSVSDAVAATLSMFFAGALVGFLIMVGARFGVFGAGTKVDSSPAESDYQEAEKREKGKSALRRFLERLLQQTPLADLALGKYDRRVAELKRLFEQGRVEEALKKSLALGEQQPPTSDVHADTPISGPGIRERLEIQATRGESSHFLAALPEGAREELEALYRQQVELSIAQSDYEHAAFILAELLDDPEAAVKVFSDAGQFAVAARLAQGRRLSPTLFIPLWYRAGEHERALRLAERHDAYQLLLETTEETDEHFRHIVRRSWSDRLAAVGDYSRALKVSEPLVGLDEKIEAERRDWMRRGLAASPTDAEVIARAIKALDFDAESGPDAMASFQQLLLERNIDAARQRKQLANLLLTPSFEEGVSAEYRKNRLPRIADLLPRTLLVDHARYGLLHSHQMLSSLADAGGQSTLAADIRRLPSVSKADSGQPMRHVTVGSSSGAKGVVAAAPLRAGRTLIAYEGGSVQLFDARNEVVWRDQIWGPRDIVPIAPGRFAIIIRDEPNERRLSIFDAETLQHVDIGALNLEAWSTTAASEGWLVYSDRQVLDLRLDQLLAPLSGGAVETLEYHWATPITIAGRMRALVRCRHGGDALWLFETSENVLERWCVSQRDLNVSYWAVSFGPLSGTPMRTTDFQAFEWIREDGQRDHLGFSLVSPKTTVKVDTPFPQIHVANDKRHPEQHECLPLAVDGKERSTIGLMDADQRIVLQLSFEGAREVSMRNTFSNDMVVLWDDLGRLVKLSLDTAEIEFSNVALRNANAARLSA
ncbi:MAG: hypothetical protein AAGD43_22020 [Pseudomonadota bacterium]